MSRGCGAHPQAAGHVFNDHPCIAQFVDHRFQVIAARMVQQHIATSGGHGAQKSTRLDAVGHHAVGGAVQLVHTLDVDAAGAVAFDLGAHGDEQLGQVRNFGFLSGVFQHRFPLGQTRGHEEVLGARHRDHVGGDARTAQTRAPSRQLGQHVAVLDVDHRAHGLQTLDVLVHGARSDGAAPRQGHLGVAAARHQRAQGQHRCAHGFDQVVRGLGVVQVGGVQGDRAVLATLGAHPHVADQAQHGGHILEARHVVQGQGLGRQQGGTQFGQGGVFGP